MSEIKKLWTKFNYIGIDVVKKAEYFNITPTIYRINILIPMEITDSLYPPRRLVTFLKGNPIMGYTAILPKKKWMDSEI